MPATAVTSLNSRTSPSTSIPLGCSLTAGESIRHVMPSPGGAEKAGPFETLGAWLHIWTPPRGVEVPEVPRRKLAIIGVVAVVVIGVAAAIAIPAINSSKKDESARQKARDATFF